MLHSPEIWRWLSPQLLEQVRELWENLSLVSLLRLPLYKAGGDDYRIETLTASFSAGQIVSCVDFVLMDDDIALEGDETFTVDFVAPHVIVKVSPLTATVTIEDDDGETSHYAC